MLKTFAEGFCILVLLSDKWITVVTVLIGCIEIKEKKRLRRTRVISLHLRTYGESMSWEVRTDSGRSAGSEKKIEKS